MSAKNAKKKGDATTNAARAGPTRGPLQARHNVGVVLGESDKQPFLVSGKAGWTALVGTEADAVLYAAAPEMKAALEAVWGEIARKWADKQKLPLTEATRKKVAKALAKANKRVPPLKRMA